MDLEANAKHNILERMLLDPSAEPAYLPLSLLEDITNGFARDSEIGSGGFAKVYKGILGNGMVAVKKLLQAYNIHEKQFIKEVSCLMKVKHKNIVRFLGYCCDAQGVILEHEGTTLMADSRQMLLCFEYLLGGSLDNYITGVSSVLEWTELYRIIKEICEGLHYLHVERHIVHLDLKPSNILLDGKMVPKIADFGLSRRFTEKQSQIFTAEVMGTLGYMAPELLNNGQITLKSDIYSLGVIITEILMGQKGYRDVEQVLDVWGNRLQSSLQDIHMKQVRVCTEIGIECTENNPAKRPFIQHIISRLDETKSDSSELYQCTPNEVPGETSSEVLDMYLNWFEKSHEDTQLEQLTVCNEECMECTEDNPIKRPVTHCTSELDEAERTRWPIETSGSSSSAAQELVVENEWLCNVNIVAPSLKQVTLFMTSNIDRDISVMAPMLDKVSWQCLYSRAPGEPSFGIWCLEKLRLQTAERQGQPTSLHIHAYTNKGSYNLYGQADNCSQAIQKHIIDAFSLLELHLETAGHVFGAFVFHLIGVNWIHSAMQRLKVVLRRSTEREECPTNCQCDPMNWKTETTSLSALEEMEIDGFEGEDHEFDFLELVFNSAPILKRVIVKLSLEDSSSRDICTKLYDIFRAYSSVKCCVYLSSGEYYVPCA